MALSIRASADSLTAASLCVYANISLPLSPTTVISTTNSGVRSAFNVSPFHVVLPSLQACGTAAAAAAPDTGPAPLALAASLPVASSPSLSPPASPPESCFCSSPGESSPSPASFSVSLLAFDALLPWPVEGSTAVGVGGLGTFRSSAGGPLPIGRMGILRVALLEDVIFTSWTQARSKNLLYRKGWRKWGVSVRNALQRHQAGFAFRHITATSVCPPNTPIEDAIQCRASASLGLGISLVRPGDVSV